MFHHSFCASPLRLLENVQKNFPFFLTGKKNTLIFKQDIWFLMYFTESFVFDPSHPHFRICFFAPQEKANVQFATCPGTPLLRVERGGMGKDRQSKHIYKSGLRPEAVATISIRHQPSICV